VSNQAASSSSSSGGREFIGDLSTFREDVQVVSAVKEDGTVEDWDLFENVWERAFSGYLKKDPKEHPVLMAEKPYNLPSARNK